VKRALAEYVQRFIDEQQISQRELADKVGISEYTIRRILNSGDVNHRTISKLARALGNDVEYLLRLAGYLPSAGYPDIDPALKALCDRTEALPPDWRRAMINVYTTVLDNVEAMLAGQITEPHAHYELGSEDSDREI
jgi:transcriptional regulator with XRE-family HTH domain